MSKRARILVGVAISFAVTAGFFPFPHLKSPARRRAERIAWNACTLDDDFDSIEEQLDQLSGDESPEADEVLVSLVGTYIGEHNTETLMTAIINRGSRMKPLLAVVRDRPVNLLSCYRKDRDDLRHTLVDEMVLAIDKGERWQ